MTDLAALDFAPLLPWPWLAALAIAALAVVGLAVARRARGAGWRGLALAILLLALANPRLVSEEGRTLPDIALVVVDESPSQDIGQRHAQTETALASLRERLARLPNLEVRIERTGAGADGTRLFEAAQQALADVPRRRLAGIFMITDGRVHDVPANAQAALVAPLHALITGQPDERDRRLVVTRNPGYALVGKTAAIGVTISDPGTNGKVELSLSVDGQTYESLRLPANQENTIQVPIGHAGANVVELAAAPGPGELSLANNRAALSISGVRDRLKVLLISGEPHAGERAWRNLLKSDPAVDLVHFTILRPPEQDDRTPIRELALITFPVRELFEEKLHDFDLVVFDRYRRRGVLPVAYYRALVDYVRGGGALLTAVGPEYAEAGGLYDSPLAAVLPAEPTGGMLDQAFVPKVTDLGRRHPVTAGLPGEGHWGEWLRQVAVTSRQGHVLLTGAEGRPLLILDRVGKGRVAQVLSDTLWLWARGYNGGGPHDELARRLAHWLMQEPDLEEEALSAEIKGNNLAVSRRSLSPEPVAVTVTAPDGKTRDLTLPDRGDGHAAAAMAIDQPGLWRVSDGDHTAIAASGPLAPLEQAELTATTVVLAPVAAATGGSVRFLALGGVPEIRRLGPDAASDGRTAAGRGWVGLPARGDKVITGVRETSLLPGWAMLGLVLAAFLVAWRREGR